MFGIFSCFGIVISLLSIAFVFLLLVIWYKLIFFKKWFSNKLRRDKLKQLSDIIFYKTDFVNIIFS
jgi:hypothetical protein